MKSYRTVFLPTFETQKMVGSRSVLKRSVKREILGLRHYNFKLRLRNSIQVVGGNVVDCNESYTSKTCGRCGFLNKSSSSETFNCTQCKFKCDRDVHGARNILMRQMVHLY